MDFIPTHFSKIQISKNVRYMPKSRVPDSRAYCSDYICLDTETSWNHDENNPDGWIYQWCFSFQKQLVYGRHASDCVQTLKQIVETLDLSKRERLVVFVHNLSYDWQYLKDFLHETFGAHESLLAVEPHKLISIVYGNIEFRCTWKLSNRSLEKWGKDLNIKHRKLVGAIDYDKIRMPETPLTRSDWQYMFRDVLCMDECLETTFQKDGDKISTLPLTSTGYVRRDARRLFKADIKNRRMFESSALDVETYLCCRRAFSGGLTHANRFYVDKTIKSKIRHADAISMYPTQQICKDFPVGKFNLLGENMTPEEVSAYTNEYCIIMDLYIEDFKLKNQKITLPYMQESKVRKGRETYLDIIADNGRILKCDGKAIISCTELDLQIFLKQYKFKKIKVLKAYASVKGRLPEWMRQLVDKYFFEKSDFKEKLETIDNDDLRLSLMKSKNKLNGIYGMTATDICRFSFDFDENGDWGQEPITIESITEKLQKYYKGKNNFMSYQYGVYTTAHARAELMTLVEAVGYEKFLYADTDSIFYIETEENKKRLDAINAEWRAEAEREHYYIDTDRGTRSFYHYFKDEGEDIRQFRALHSKCYAYVTADEKLHCTIAGVTARSPDRKITREQELGDIERLTPGTVFKACGGTRCVYVEQDADKHSAAIIMPSEKTLHGFIDEPLFDYIEE